MVLYSNLFPLILRILFLKNRIAIKTYILIKILKYFWTDKNNELSTLDFTIEVALSLFKNSILFATSPLNTSLSLIKPISIELVDKNQEIRKDKINK